MQAAAHNLFTDTKGEAQATFPAAATVVMNTPDRPQTRADRTSAAAAMTVRYRRSDIEAYEQAGFVSREPAGTTPVSDSSDVRETVERLIRTLGS